MGAIPERPAGLDENPVLTQSFLHTDKSFFPNDIDVNHWQLHHLITSPEEDQIYFVEDTKICRLDIVTRQKDVVSELPFRPSCTAAGFGWFCAGDNNNAGYLAYLRVGDVPSQSKSNSSHPTSQLRHPPIQVVKWAKDIVNSISLHKLPGRNGDDAEVVAVVTNNDNSVCIYSLSNEQVVSKFHFDFAMNHATISPDGVYLVAVGDKPWLYVYRNTSIVPGRKADKSSMPSNTGPSSSSWEFLRRVRLHKPATADKEAYFTTAWSHESTLLATASQNGYITLIDTIGLDNLEDDPTLIVTRSSNPPDPRSDRGGPGSVRTMAFLPSPWDFLLWVEHSGTACLGDLRDGLRTRQVIDLDSMGDDITMLDIEDYSDMPALESADEALRASDADLISRAHAVHLAPAQSRATHSSSPIDSLEGYPYTLTDDERQIIDGLRTTREREAAELSRRLDIHTPQSRLTPVSIRYPVSGPSPAARESDESASLYMGHGARRSSLSASASRIQEIRSAVANSEASGSASVHSARTERLSNRPMNWSNFLQSSDTIRSVVRQELLRAREDNSTPQRDDAEATQPRRTGAPADVDARLSSDLVNHQLMRAQRARQRRAQAEAIPTRWIFGGRDPGQRTTPYRIGADEITELTTTGHIVSEDGRTLYIGTTKGIFEVHPDFRTRKFWPSYETR